MSGPTQSLAPKRLCGAMLILSLVATAPAPAAVITVKTDRNPAVLQESFQLIFEANGRVDGDPDFTPLEKDFQILSTSVSSSMNIINSRITNIKQWQLTVFAKRAGALIVPAIAFGKDRSPPSSLMVKKTAASANPPEQQDVFVEVEATPATAYVQSEIIYRVRLFRSLPMSNETLSDPKLNQGKAVIEPLEDDKSYETTLKGRRFGVFERRYAVYPQVSGPLAFAPVRYQGQAAAGGLFGYDPFGPKPRTLIRQSRPVQLEIKPAPASYQAQHWLPAKSVKIAEEWSGDPFALSSGEPATRTVTVTAEGLTASQLPALPEQRFADFRQYPDKPTLTERKTGAGITGERRQKSAIIPMRAGEYVLPEIVLPWWNTETMTMERAVLPARKVKVAASAPEAGADLLGLPPPAPMPDAADATGAVSGAPDIAGAAAPIIADDNAVADAGARQPVGRVWQWLTLALAAAWLATIIYMLRERRQRRPAADPNLETLKTDEAMKALKKACRDNDSQQAKAALLQWARSQAGPPVSSLGDVEKRSGEKLANEIRDLSRRLYARGAGPWQGEPLWQAFIQETKASKTTSKTAPPGKLEPLFRL